MQERINANARGSYEIFIFFHGCGYYNKKILKIVFNVFGVDIEKYITVKHFNSMSLWDVGAHGYLLITFFIIFELVRLLGKVTGLVPH